MPDNDPHVSETDVDDDLDSVVNDENTPVNDENTFEHDSAYAPVYRSSSVLALRTPRSHSHSSHDTALRDITDQFFHPPSPSPVRISKLKRAAPNTIEPPRRPKKPKSLAYPADPPNWLYSCPSSSLPPSSPFPPSDNAREADRAATARYEYHMSNASDSDPFGFVAVERAVKAKRPPAPRKVTSRISAVKSPPRSTVLPSASSHASVFASFSQLDAPVPTNNEDIDGLYADEPVAGPSHVHVPVAPLLMMTSDQPLVEIAETRSQATFPDPLRTPRKRKRRASPAPLGGADSDEQGTDPPSTPSPVKVSVGAGTHRRPPPSRVPGPKRTRAQARAESGAKIPNPQPSRTKRVNTSSQRIPTPSSTPASVRPSSRSSTAPPTPVPPRRSTRRAAVGASVKLNDSSSTSDGEDSGRMKLRSRSAKGNVETKSSKSTTRAKQPPSKSKVSTKKTRRATATTSAKPARGRPKGKANAKSAKGKGKSRPLESVLDLSDDTRERYDKERRERVEYFKRLEGYEIQKENVYVV